MKLFGLLIPAYRQGSSVVVADPVCARGQVAEHLFQWLDKKNEYKHNLYGSPKRGAVGQIKSIMKYKDSEGSTFIYYGVVVKNLLYAIEESRLARQ
ncbi:hypothetical protein [Paenibacillus xylaniclasticus]|uniref:hypothetical protein n=1 Tax=Paenibacillus xylaniclasticus TaxID=588083 RepID=UPI000FDC2B2B|nr:MULTISPECIES: hypothetical protein [Paenibacillus]GFN30939.1 hypothetical protein PCURB6_11990 [Paenibacillus curdlanolyticus]